MKYKQYLLKVHPNAATSENAPQAQIAASICNAELLVAGRGIFFECQPACEQTIAENDAHLCLLDLHIDLQNCLSIDVKEGVCDE